MLKQPDQAIESPHIYSWAYYERLFEIELRHWWSSGMRRIAQRLLDPLLLDRSNVQILDAGCGTGGMFVTLARYADPENIIGIDVSRHALDFCQRRRLGQMAQVSITQLPFSADRFDLVVCEDVVQHLTRDGSDGEALRECLRVLRPGGITLLRTNAFWGPVVQNGASEPEAGEPNDYHQYTREELGQIMVDAGFEVQTLSYVNMIPGLVRAGIRRFKRQRSHSHARIHNPGLGIKTPPAGINAVMRWLARWEAWYLARPHRSLPYGHSIICLATKPRLS